VVGSKKPRAARRPESAALGAATRRRAIPDFFFFFFAKKIHNSGQPTISFLCTTSVFTGDFAGESDEKG
jgi:hypothetical protein